MKKTHEEVLRRENELLKQMYKGFLHDFLERELAILEIDEEQQKQKEVNEEFETRKILVNLYVFCALKANSLHFSKEIVFDNALLVNLWYMNESDLLNEIIPLAKGVVYPEKQRLFGITRGKSKATVRSVSYLESPVTRTNSVEALF